jgi:xylose isomerase
MTNDPLERLSRTYSSQNVQALKERAFDRTSLGERGVGLERLDQLTVELLLGVH